MTSPQIDAVVTALVKARPHFKPVVREATGQVGQNRAYKYADLSGVLDATVTALADAGLVVVQLVDAETSTLVSRLCHISGQWIESRYPLRTYDKPQELGSALTYARRYSLLGLLGVAQEDDDGATAQQSEAHPAPTHAKPAPAPAPAPPAAAKPSGTAKVISEAQRKRMYAIGKHAGWTDDEMKTLLHRYGFDSSKNVTADVYDTICKTLEAGHVETEPDDHGPDASEPSDYDDSAQDLF